MAKEPYSGVISTWEWGGGAPQKKSFYLVLVRQIFKFLEKNHKGGPFCQKFFSRMGGGAARCSSPQITPLSLGIVYVLHLSYGPLTILPHHSPNFFTPS